MKTELDSFSGAKIYPSKGKLYVRGDSKVFRFANGKSESLFLQRKNPRRIAWTVLFRRARKKGISEEIVKKRTRRTVKHQRAIVGASLDVIKEKKLLGRKSVRRHVPKPSWLGRRRRLRLKAKKKQRRQSRRRMPQRDKGRRLANKAQKVLYPSLLQNPVRIYLQWCWFPFFAHYSLSTVFFRVQLLSYFDKRHPIFGFNNKNTVAGQRE